jgi:hypothetical protein
MTDTAWYYAWNKQRVGPVSFAELQQRAAMGQLQPTDMLLQVGAPKWVSAASVPGLITGAPVDLVPILPVPDQAREAQGLGAHYWLMQGETPVGPYDVQKIHAKLVAGEITWQTKACPVGAGSWLPLVQVPGLGPINAAPVKVMPGVPPVEVMPEVPPVEAMPGVPPGFAQEAIAIIPAVLPAKVASLAPTTRTRADIIVGPTPAPSVPRPWNPATIAWLGLVFTPLWAGVMAAINSKRLRSPISMWLPLLIGFGYLGFDWALSAVGIESYVLDLLLYGGVVLLLWGVVLKPQSALFAPWQMPAAGPQGSWVWPTVAGVPLALLAISAFVIAPLLPWEPREVCERFLKATSAKQAEPYVTVNLLPALQALEKAGSADSNAPFHLELTDEGPAPANVGGYFVGCRGVFMEAGQPQQVEGVFHLVNWTNAWKIEDLYFTTVNRQPLEPWLSLARDYAILRQSSPPPLTPRGSGPADANPRASSAPQGKGQTFWTYRNGRGLTVLFTLAVMFFGWLSKEFQKKGPSKR